MVSRISPNKSPIHCQRHQLQAHPICCSVAQLRDLATRCFWQPARRVAYENAPSGNRTRGISLATRYFTTKPTALAYTHTHSHTHKLALQTTNTASSRGHRALTAIDRPLACYYYRPLQVTAMSNQSTISLQPSTTVYDRFDTAAAQTTRHSRLLDLAEAPTPSHA